MPILLQDILLDYIQAGMKTPFKTEKPFWLPIGGAIAIGLSIIELFSYFYIFYYLYKHDTALSILPEETKKSRNRYNAQTLMGQFYLYLTDTGYLVFLLVTFLPGYSLPPETKDFIAVLKNAEFGVLSFMHCFLIPHYRARIIEKFKKLPSFLKFQKRD
jgi:hypothetical protein